MKKYWKSAVLAIFAALFLTASMPAMAMPRGGEPGQGLIRKIVRIIHLVIHGTDDGGMLIPPIPH